MVVVDVIDEILLAVYLKATKGALEKLADAMV